MRRLRSTALGVAWRTLHNFVTNPSLLLPALIFPIFFLVAFAGGLSAVEDAPGFDFPAGYTAFQFVFVFLQSATFGGVFTGFSIAADFESGFARRMMLAAPHRTGIVAGYAVAAVARWTLTATIITALALAAGMQVLGGPVDLFGLLGLGLIVNVAATLGAAGVALRIRSVQAGPLMQIPAFVTLFLAPVYVPLDLLEGWIRAVAELNPATALLEAGRGLIAGEPTGVGVAYAAALALAAVMAAWALRGLRRAEAGV